MNPPAGPLIGVLALQGDVPEHLRALGEAGARAVPVRRPAELDDIGGLVIPGGESTTLWRLSAAFDMLEPLRKLIGAGLPAFGSCAGMIMLADRLADGVPGQQTYGGIDMTVRRNAFGRQVDSFESDIALSGLPAAAGPLENDALDTLRNIWIKLGGQRRRRVDVIAEDLKIAVGRKRHVGSQHFIQRHAERVNIGAEIYALPLTCSGDM